MADQPLSTVVDDLLAKILGPMGLGHWQVKVLFGSGENTAAANAMPEYLILTISIDPDKLQTGDELDEILCHEASHAFTWPCAEMSEDLAIALAEMLPEPFIRPVGKLLAELCRRAEEQTTTAVGRSMVGLLRKLWQLEADLTTARAEIRALRKVVKDPQA